MRRYPEGIPRSGDLGEFLIFCPGCFKLGPQGELPPCEILGRAPGCRHCRAHLLQALLLSGQGFLQPGRGFLGLLELLGKVFPAGSGLDSFGQLLNLLLCLGKGFGGLGAFLFQVGKGLYAAQRFGYSRRSRREFILHLTKIGLNVFRIDTDSNF